MRWYMRHQHAMGELAQSVVFIRKMPKNYQMMIFQYCLGQREISGGTGRNDSQADTYEMMPPIITCC